VTSRDCLSAGQIGSPPLRALRHRQPSEVSPRRGDVVAVGRCFVQSRCAYVVKGTGWRAVGTSSRASRCIRATEGRGCRSYSFTATGSRAVTCSLWRGGSPTRARSSSLTCRVTGEATFRASRWESARWRAPFRLGWMWLVWSDRRSWEARWAVRSSPSWRGDSLSVSGRSCFSARPSTRAGVPRAGRSSGRCVMRRGSLRSWWH
jgi:hypothetical protein